jgi:hypothetical protein
MDTYKCEAFEFYLNLTTLHFLLSSISLLLPCDNTQLPKERKILLQAKYDIPKSIQSECQWVLFWVKLHRESSKSKDLKTRSS